MRGKSGQSERLTTFPEMKAVARDRYGERGESLGREGGGGARRARSGSGAASRVAVVCLASYSSRDNATIRMMASAGGDVIAEVLSPVAIISWLVGWALFFVGDGVGANAGANFWTDGPQRMTSTSFSARFVRPLAPRFYPPVQLCCNGGDRQTLARVPNPYAILSGHGGHR